MITSGRGRVRGADGESGSALIIVLMMISMLGVLTLTLATLSVNNLTGARRAHEAGRALNAAEAGVAQAVAYMRANPVSDLECSPGCPDNRWGNEADPQTITVPGTNGASSNVWIKPVAPYPANKEGLYKVHSTGVAGSLGGRSVTADVMVAPQKFPLGIFGKSISGGGDAEVHYQSMFTTGCVYQRAGIEFSGTDILNDIPASMHSSQIITTSNGSGVNCPSTNNPIHTGTAAAPAGYCKSAYPYDQDSRGGPLVGTPCLGAGGAYPQTSKIVDDDDLFAKYNLRSPPLTAAQLERLKSVAMSQGNYWTNSNSSEWSSPNEANAVMYFDLLKSDAGGTVDLNDVVGFGRPHSLSATDPACTARSLVIIVEGGHVTLNSNQKLAASVFVLGDDPYGNVKHANGTAGFIGTLYANNINLVGTVNLRMDECFKSNLSPSLFDVEASNYREEDRG